MSILYHNHLVYRTGRRGGEGSVSSFLNGRYREKFVIILTDHMQ